MKSLIALTVLVFSVNSFAHSVGNSTLITSFVTDVSTNGFNICKEAAQVLEDANNFYATGESSVSLTAHIKNIQSESRVSDEEAVDMLVASAQDILANN
jgi:hypothetical protein